MSRNKQRGPWAQCALVALSFSAVYLAMVEPSLAGSIDLSPITEFFNSLISAFTGNLGKSAATLAIIGALFTWFFGIIDLRMLIWIVVAIVCIGSAGTIVSSLWGA